MTNAATFSEVSYNIIRDSAVTDAVPLMFTL